MASFLGMYIKDLSRMFAAIYDLMYKGVKFEWKEECQKAFKAAKDAMSKAIRQACYSCSLTQLSHLLFNFFIPELSFLYQFS